jgi:DnaJ-like protein
VTVLLVLLLVGVIVAGVGARQPGAGQPARRGAKRSGRGKPPSIYWYLAAAVVAVVLLRFGFSWLAVAGGALVALLRSVAPLLRWLPLFQTLNDPGGSRARPGPGAGGSSPGERVESPRSRMTRQEALQVFGLDESATRDDVQREYRRLMRKVHPDLGGSSYLAAKINEAKDVLS